MNTIKGFFAGSGADAFSDASVVAKLLSLVEGSGPAGRVRVAYIGTATYDLPGPMVDQTTLLAQGGCEVRPVRLADPRVTAITSEDDTFIRNEADVILVSGGNTLYAIRRWEETGLDVALRAAAERKALLAGGSAGAICWFTSGHSDSADPSTYPARMIKVALGEAEGGEEKAGSTSWSYIRVRGLNLLPGLVCPHFDKTQSNGVRREADVAKMVRRHHTERGLGIDHWAVLVLPGDGTYEVFAAAGKTREPPTEEGDSDEAATTEQPSIFALDVVQGELEKTLPPRMGPLSALLRAATGPVVSDPFERFYAMENPTPSSGSLVRR